MLGGVFVAQVHKCLCLCTCVGTKCVCVEGSQMQHEKVKEDTVRMQEEKGWGLGQGHRSGKASSQKGS